MGTLTWQNISKIYMGQVEGVGWFHMEWPTMCMCGCAKFQVKQTTLTFSVQISPKMDVGLAIQKTNVGIRIIIVKMPCVPIFRKNKLWLFRPKFAQKWVLGSEFQNLSPDLESSSLRYYVHQFSNKTNIFEFSGPNLPKNKFWGRNFKSLSLDLESAPPIYHACRFWVKMDSS